MPSRCDSFLKLLPLTGLLYVLAGCDAGEPALTDAAADGNPWGDAPPTDDRAAFEDAAVAPDAHPDDAPRWRPVGPCAERALVDLDARGVRTGDVTTYTGSNAAAPAASVVVGTCGGRPGHLVAFRYTVRARSRLIVSTFHQGTTANLDTVVWAQTACRPMDPGIGCNDDVGAPYDLRGRPVSGRFHSMFTTTEPTGGHADHTLDAGTTVFVFVGSYTPTTGSVVPRTFELTVTEVAAPSRVGAACEPLAEGADGTPGAECPEGSSCRIAGMDYSSFACVAPVTAGGMCDASQVANVCAPGTTCRSATGGWRCVVEGVANGPCRGRSPQCDAGLACNSYGMCRTELPLGAGCDTTGGSNVCVTGSSCVGVAGGARCVAHGAAQGTCRGGETPCDAGLLCVYSMCVPAAPPGGLCGPSAGGAACAGGTCVTQMGGSRCVAEGGPGARCRGSAPACDAGLACGYGGSCVPEVPVGATCDASGGRSVTNLCVPTAACQTVMGVSRCIARGVVGNPCRTSAPFCDAGLACGSGGCVTEAALGAPCDPRRVANVCAEGTSCLTEMEVSRCVLPGAVGRPCRGAHFSVSAPRTAALGAAPREWTKHSMMRSIGGAGRRGP